MFRGVFIAFFVLTNLFCNAQKAQTNTNPVKDDLPSVSISPVDSQNKKSDEKAGEVVETFSDAKNVGVRGKNKIEISMMRKTNYSSDVELKFYSLDGRGDWKLKQKIQLESGSNRLDAKLSDFNNDGLNDLTYVSALAARGANEVRTLFIYDKAKDELIHIKNSEEYPNLLYNRELDCLDSQMFHGTSTTVFVKIEDNTLKEFASVDNGGSTRTVYVIGKDGKEKVLREDKITEDKIYARYKNYNPLKEYTSADLKQKNRKRVRGKL